jgi:hypothetical protein
MQRHTQTDTGEREREIERQKYGQTYIQKEIEAER